MRKRKNGGAAVKNVTPLLGITVFMCAAVIITRGNPELLDKAGEGMAIISAAIYMPDSGLDIIRERFRSEIYGDDGLLETVPDKGNPVWPPSQVIIDHKEPEASDPIPEEGRDTDQAPQKPPPKIPEKYAAPIISENFAVTDSEAFTQFGSGFIRNDTAHSKEEIGEILDTPFSIIFEDTDEPQVLIVHTHATESYEKHDRDEYDIRNTWRSTDNSINMVAVGDVMAEELEQNGISVIHDTTQHDYPSYNGSYERSAVTISDYLEAYPSIKVVLDLHRDAMQRDDAIVKPVAVIDGKKAAQIMIIAACDDGSMGIPEWRENLRFAAAFQDYMASAYKDLTKPVFFCYRKYNMDLTTGSLLLEFGSNANTLEEAVYSAKMCGEALSRMIRDNMA